MMMIGRCYAYGSMFKPFQIPYQSPISDLSLVINRSIQYQKDQNFYALLYICLLLSSQSGWANISSEEHCHWFAHNPHVQADQALDLVGGLEEEGELVLTGCLSSDWAYIAPEGHCFDLDLDL